MLIRARPPALHTPTRCLSMILWLQRAQLSLPSVIAVFAMLGFYAASVYSHLVCIDLETIYRSCG